MMRTARNLVMVVVGCLNIVFFPLGIAYFLWAWKPLVAWHGVASSTEWIVFTGIAASGLLQVTFQAYFGIGLLRKHEAAITPATFTFLFAFCFLMFVGASWFSVPAGDLRMRSVVVGLWGVAEGLMIPQLALYYPVFGLIAMFALWALEHRQRKTL